VKTFDDTLTLQAQTAAKRSIRNARNAHDSRALDDFTIVKTSIGRPSVVGMSNSDVCAFCAVRTKDAHLNITFFMDFLIGQFFQLVVQYVAAGFLEDVEESLHSFMA
jgi:hypothetical protein